MCLCDYLDGVFLHTINIKTGIKHRNKIIEIYRKIENDLKKQILNIDWQTDFQHSSISTRHFIYCLMHTYYRVHLVEVQF